MAKKYIDTAGLTYVFKKIRAGYLALTGGTMSDANGEYEATLAPEKIELYAEDMATTIAAGHVKVSQESERGEEAATLTRRELSFFRTDEDEETGDEITEAIGVVRGLKETEDETAAVPYGQMVKYVSENSSGPYKLTLDTPIVTDKEFTASISTLACSPAQTLTDGDLYWLDCVYNYTDHPVGYNRMVGEVVNGVVAWNGTEITYNGAQITARNPDAESIVLTIAKVLEFEKLDVPFADIEGSDNIASGGDSHVEGFETRATNWNAHAEGRGTLASGPNSHAQGRMSTASGAGSHAEGYVTVSSGNYGSHAEGYKTEASGEYGSHAEGQETKATGAGSHAEGYAAEANGNYSHAEGYGAKTIGKASHAEGDRTNASGLVSHAEGQGSVASGDVSHAEGKETSAGGDYSHAEGQSTNSSGAASHAEGYDTEASGNGAHAEGQTSVASGVASHAEGYKTTASHNAAHAEGQQTVASATTTHAEGFATIASTAYQHVQGKYNVEGPEAHIVGWGTAGNRKNIHTIDGNGNAWFAGDVYVKSTGGTNKDNGSKKLATADLSNVTTASFSKRAVEAKVGLPVANATSTDGVAYTASVNGVTSLYTGLTLTIIPSMQSASRTPTLNLNGLGATRIAKPLNGSNTSATTQPHIVINDETSEEDVQSKIAVASKWLSANKPVTVRYDGSVWETIDFVQQSAQNLYGVVPIESGGTGADNAADARANLGAAPAYTYGTTDLVAGTSELATGVLHFVYEE